MSTAVRIVLLVALWLLAWGTVSVANIVSGVVVAAVLLLAFPPRRERTSGVRLHPIGLLRLFVYVLGQLLTSNVLVAREVVSRRSRIRTGVLAYRVRHPADEVVTLIANVIALTPGTMTVDVRDPAVVYVHFLLLEDFEEARRSLARLEDHVVAALGNPPPQQGAERTERGEPR